MKFNDLYGKVQYMANNIGIVGVGNMGKSIVSGIVQSNFVSEEHIYVCGHTIPQDIEKCNINVTTLSELVEKSDYIILCIKPNGFDSLSREIRNIGGFENKVFVSIAAGIRLDSLQKMFPAARVIRAMPNLALMSDAGMTTVCCMDNIAKQDIEFVSDMFSCSGKCMLVPEKLMDACTAISGSGPAYVFMFIEALADAAVKHGIKRSDAYILASQTVLGSAKMQLDTSAHPAVLKDMVCSPGGTTIEAVCALENSGLRSAVINAVDACAEKSRTMM